MPYTVLVPSPPLTGSTLTPAAPSEVTYKVYADTGFTSPQTLTQWFDEMTVDTLNDVGSIGCKLQNDDTQLLTYCSRGAVLQKCLDGTPVFAGFIDRTVRHTLAQGEEVDQFTELSGSGLASVLARAVVQPLFGYDQPLWSEARAFGSGNLEYDDSSWGFATAIVDRQDAESEFYTGLPSGWCDPAASWIGPSGTDDTGAYIGNWWTHGDFTLAAGTAVVFFLAADNRARVSLNGLDIVEFGTDLAFTETHRVTLYLPAGDYRIEAKVSNFLDGGFDPGPGRGDFTDGDPTSFLCAAFEIDQQGRLGDLIIRSDTSWKILEYPASPPGRTIGDITDQLLTEAQTASADPDVANLTWDFGVVNDTDSNPFDTQESVTLLVGDGLLSVLRSFGGVYCDWAFAADAPNLSMWRLGERGSLKDVEYQAGVNLTTLTHDSVLVGTDALLVTWSGGQFLYPATGGTKFAAFNAGTARTRGEAETIAAQQLTLLGGTRAAFTVDIEPVGLDDQPYTGVTVGDVATIPDEYDVPSSQRLVQIVGKTDPEGNPDWSPSFRDVRLDVQARIALNLNRMVNGTLGGNSVAASPGGTPPPFGSKISTSEVTFSSPDPVVVGEATKHKVPSESGNLYAVAITAKTAGSTDTDLEFLVDGNDVLGGNGTLPATEQFVLIPVDYASRSTVWVEGNKSRLTVNITAVGTDVAGLLIEPRFL